MNYNHPYTLWMQEIVASIPMVPQVSDEVVEVISKTNVLMRRDELLFRINGICYRIWLNKLKADLAAGETTLRMKQATIDDASAGVQQTQAEYDRVIRGYQRYARGAVMPVNPFSEQDMTHIRQQVQIQTAVLQAVKTQLQNARRRVSGRYNGLDTNIASLRSQILEAGYNLAQTVVRASGDGYVTQLLARPGTTAVRLPFKPVLMFTPQQKRQVVTVFHQNSILRLTVEDSAEVVSNGLPGSVYSGKISRMLPAIPDSSYQANGALRGPGAGTRKESIYVPIDLDPHLEVEHLPDGVSAQVVVYTDYSVHVSITRKALPRMTSWLYYLYLDH